MYRYIAVTSLLLYGAMNYFLGAFHFVVCCPERVQWYADLDSISRVASVGIPDGLNAHRYFVLDEGLSSYTYLANYTIGQQ